MVFFNPLHEHHNVDVEMRFRESVNKALNQVKSILDHTRHPRLAEHEDHTYDDKFTLAEFVTNTAVAAQIKALERLGLNGEKLQTICKWVHADHKSVTLRLEASDSCRFIKERIIDVVTSSPEVQKTTTTSVTTSPSTTVTSQSEVETTNVQVVNKVKEYHWTVEVSYRLVVFPGADTSVAVELLSRSTSTCIITSGGQAVGFGSSAAFHEPPTPIPESTQHPPIDVNATWLFQQVEPNERICQFRIDRNSEKAQKTCKTPRRNENVDAAYDFFGNLFNWAQKVMLYLTDQVEDIIAFAHSPAQKNAVVADSPETVELGSRCLITGMENSSSLNGKAVIVKEYLSEEQIFRVEHVEKNDGASLPLLIKPENLILDGVSQVPILVLSVSRESLFCPILPLMENGAVFGNVGDLLQEQSRSLDEAIRGLTQIFPSPQLGKLVSVAEATLLLIIYHLEDICTRYFGSVDYIEKLLHQQLVQAIGKEVCPSDFDRFMVFHNAKIFGANFAPSPFTYSVRRPGPFPDGTFSIECTRQRNEPIHSMARRVPRDSVTSMFMPINAATAVELKGDRFLHGWMLHEFKSHSRDSYELIARARQFSSFLFVIGTLEGSNKFQPKDAIILQNKDEVLIPLLMSTLPSAKEFKDSIASLSPEQQAFARSYRNMQLASSVFGLCVIQLKPQLEKLLGLPEGALTKEIELTQNLMSLFVEYQIPSDLLACGDLEDSHRAAKISAVKSYVKSILDVIESSKNKQLNDEKDRANMRGVQVVGNAGKLQCAVTSQIYDEPWLGCGTVGPLTEEQKRAQEMADALNWLRNSDDYSVKSFDSIVEGGMSDEFMTEEQKRAKEMADVLNFLRNSNDYSVESFKSTEVGGMSLVGDAGKLDFRRGCCAKRGVADDSSCGADGFMTEEQKRAEAMADALNWLRAADDISVVDVKSTEVGGMLVVGDVGRVGPTQLSPQGNNAMPENPVTPIHGEDFTLIPKLLDAKLEKSDFNNSLRSTVIKAGSNWTLNRQENLLASLEKKSLNDRDIKSETAKAFDLLDAISRSGDLPINSCEIHVIIAVSHFFENDVMGTIIQDNANPIEQVDRSSLMIASVIYNEPLSNLLDDTNYFQRLMMNRRSSACASDTDTQLETVTNPKH